MDCVWSNWGAYTECSGICGTGTRNRTRKITVRPNHGGSDCVGNFTQVDDTCIISDNPECPGEYQNFKKNFETSLVTFNLHYQSHAKSVNGMTWAAVVQAVEAAIRNKFVIYY